jgi:hypothetical protein
MAAQHAQQSEGRAPLDNPRRQRLFGIFGANTKLARLMREKLIERAIQAHRPSDIRGSEMDDRREPFGMPFANREVAVIIANALNRHSRGIWFYTVERQIEGKRWIIVRDDGEMTAPRAQRRPLRAIAGGLRARKGHWISHEGVALRATGTR